MQRSSKIKAGAFALAMAAASGAAMVLAGPAQAATGCQVTYTANEWTTSPGQGGFTAAISVTNLGDPLTAWTLRFTYPGTQTVTLPGWSATWSQVGANVTGTNASFNGNLGTGASTSIGFNGAWNGSNPRPTSFSLNNVVCTGSTTTNPPATTTPPPGNTPPTVSLTSPANGATFTAPATVALAANASDANGTVQRVEFLNGTTILNSDTTSPYSFSWTNVAAGTYSITARAFDNAGASTTSAASTITVGGGGNTAAAPALHVSGNRLLTASGATYRLLGVNRAGGEYRCIQGGGMWDGTMDQSTLNAMRTWKVRALRIPLNEECWLGNGIVPAGDIPAGGTQGAAYQSAVTTFVNQVVAAGITPIVEMHWNFGVYTGNSAGACPNPSSPVAACQKPMPDAQFAPMFWTSVANAFKGNNAVILDLFNEPFPERATGNATTGWTCWRDGGTCAGIPYQVAGFQTLVNSVRATGATNVIMVGGLAFSNDLTQWLQFRPTDPTGNLMAFAHIYNFNTCSNTACFDSQMAPVAAQVPLALTEIGENDCAHGFIDTIMNWADSHGVGYLGWTWNANFPCNTGPGLISTDSGTPTNFGIGLRDHLNLVSN